MEDLGIRNQQKVEQMRRNAGDAIKQAYGLQEQLTKAKEDLKKYEGEEKQPSVVKNRQGRSIRKSSNLLEKTRVLVTSVPYHEGQKVVACDGELWKNVLEEVEKQ